MEIWDIYNEQGEKTGEEIIRGNLLKEGQFHLVVNIIVKHKDGTYLILKRDLKKILYAGMDEIGAGGCVVKGEGPLEGAIRELKEETGINAETLRFLKVVTNKDRKAIYYMYLFETDMDKNGIILQMGETINYKWITRKELEDYLESGNCIKSQQFRVNQVLDMI